MDQKIKQPPSIAMLLFLVSFGSVSAVLFTPSLPLIKNFFNLSIEKVQLTITIFLLGYAIGQLPYGPLANAFGRKKALLIGLAVAILGSLLSAFSYHLHSFSTLLVGRFLQALGASAGLKLSYTMIADIFKHTEVIRIISYITIAFAVMPSVAIAIGGFLTYYYDWESCFYFLSIVGVTMFALSLRLSETAKTIDRNALKIKVMIQGYHAKIKNRQLMLCAVLLGGCSATVYIFATKAPFIGINLIGLSPISFGLYNLLPAIGMLTGSLLAAKIAGRHPVYKIFFKSILLFFFSIFFMLIPFSLGKISVFSLFLPMLPIYIGQTIIFTNASSYGLVMAENKANASAILNFISVGTALIGVLMAEFIFPHSALALPIFFLIIALLFFFIELKLKKLLMLR